MQRHDSFRSRGIKIESVKSAIQLHWFPWLLCDEKLVFWSPSPLYTMTSCPARRCSGIRAPLNFVASLLTVAPLLWLRSASSIPDRSLNPQMTSLRSYFLCFELLLASKKKKKKPFSNGKTPSLLVSTSSPGGSLPFRSRDLLAVGRCASCSLCRSFNPWR